MNPWHTDLLEQWLNGNRKDVVEALIKDGKFSDAVLFAAMLNNADRATLVKMLQNRDN